VKRDVAEQLQLMALSVQARMRETLDYAGDHCSPEDVTRIGMVAGRVISALIDGILGSRCDPTLGMEPDESPRNPQSAARIPRWDRIVAE
jgi:hypothetical protein